MESTITDPLVGRRLGGRYHLTALVARGGMATVYTATDERLQRTVAVKVMHRSLAEDPNFVRRFVREARAAATLSHPGVVAVFDQGEDSGLVYLVMEYVQGRTLRDELTAAHAGQAAMPPQRALLIMDQVLSALASAHDAGLVHLDIKPENVLLRADGQAKVADFGLARATSSGAGSGATQAAATSSRGVLMGTIAYLSPEQVTHGIAGTRSDVYAAGIMTYELLTGVKPHTGDSPIQIAYQHVNTDVPPPSRRVSSLPAYVDGLVHTATARDRMARPSDARGFLEQLRRVRAAFEQGVDDPELTADLSRVHQPAGPPREHTLIVPSDLGTADGHGGGPPAEDADTAPVPPPPAKPKRNRRRVLAVGLATLLVLALAGGAGWYFGVARYTDLPNLQTLTEAEAKAKLAGLELEYDVTERVYRERFARGQIVSSEPDAGSRVLKGSTVEVLVSRGPERFVMPTLAGATERAARALLKKTNLAVGDVKREYSEDVDKGRVISASQDPGSRLRRGTEINFVVSKGREPIHVPQVTGKNGDEAEQTIRDAQLTPKRAEEFSDNVPAGQVISQAPADGTLFRGGKVTITVSKGPEKIEVPHVVRKPLAEAKKTLEDAGLVVNVTKSPFYSGLDVVLRQEPQKGKLRRGETVTIELL